MANYDTIKGAFLEVVDNRMAKTRIMRELDDIRANSVFLTKDPNSIKTYSALYSEMKDKVLRAA